MSNQIDSAKRDQQCTQCSSRKPDCCQVHRDCFNHNENDQQNEPHDIAHGSFFLSLFKTSNLFVLYRICFFSRFVKSKTRKL
ncbi:hypothetical protein EVA_13921 [gut metagenome]|uniref:Uncharacterized protein n=1 Tax=gut metagenome TaxID=749906 RepID=J9G856_9ZZZZ